MKTKHQHTTKPGRALRFLAFLVAVTGFTDPSNANERLQILHLASAHGGALAFSSRYAPGDAANPSVAHRSEWRTEGDINSTDVGMRVALAHGGNKAELLALAHGGCRQDLLVSAHGGCRQAGEIV
jgi:hypothetical protein